MTTRIKLRRDTAANWTANNPILALGEPGLETDTGLIKYGDGTTAWNTLSYAAGGGGGLKSRWVGLYNTCGNGQYVTSSADGATWTAEHVIEFGYIGYELYTFDMAMGNNRIVYLNSYGPYGWITYAKSPEEPTVNPLTLDITTRGPNGENVTWTNVVFANGYFIVSGSYYDTTYTTHGNYPIFAYSTDGATWHRGAIDQAYIASLTAAEIAGGDSGVTGMIIMGVAASSAGWLLGLEWWYGEGSPIDPANAGAFFIPSLSNTLDSSHYRNLAPIANQKPGGGPAAESAVHNDGIGWVMTDYDSAIYINTNADATGSWTTIDINAAEVSAFGNLQDGDIYDVNAGTVNGQHLIFVAYSNGRVIITSDRGSTWHGVVPIPDVATVSTVVASSTGGITFGYGSSVDQGRVIITGASVPAMNGTFYLGSLSNGSYPLFSDGGLNTPVDTTTWTANHVTVTIASTNYGSNIVNIIDATGLSPGMCTGSVGWPGNSIVSISGNVLTMKYPVYSTEGFETAIFTPQATFSLGDEIFGIFISPTSVIALSSYDTTSVATNPLQQSSWSLGGIEIGANDYETDGHGLAWLTTLAYGSYISIPTAWEYTPSDNEPGVINTMSLAESFQVSVTETGNFADPNTVSLVMDPTVGGWKLSSLALNGYDEGSISSYYNDSVQMSISGYRLALNSDGQILIDSGGTNRASIQAGSYGGVFISGRNSGTVYNALTVDYYEGSSSQPIIAIGPKANLSPIDGNTIAIGYGAGQLGQAGHAIAIGSRSGRPGQGDSAIAIGACANGEIGTGGTAQSANSIVINAQGLNSPLFDAGASTLVIKPIRNYNGPSSLYYDSSTGEITYGALPSQVVAVPTTSKGAPGDLSGQLAYSSGYIYYCTTDYTISGLATVGTGGVGNFQYSGTAMSWNLAIQDRSTDLTGWTFTIQGHDLGSVITVATWVNNNDGTVSVTYNNNWGPVNLFVSTTITFTAPLPDIWKRVAWSADTW